MIKVSIAAILNLVVVVGQELVYLHYH